MLDLTAPAGGNRASHKRIVLSADQQRSVATWFVRLARNHLGLSEVRAGPIVVEALARLTPDETMSKMTMFRTMVEEMRTYQTDPAAYEARVRATEYEVVALKQDAPSDLATISPDLLRLFAPATVPLAYGSDDEWWHFAYHYPDGGEIDGPALARLVGWELDALAEYVREHHREAVRWRGSLVDLRLTLLHQTRAVRFAGGLGDDPESQREVRSLLSAIAALQPPEGLN